MESEQEYLIAAEVAKRLRVTTKALTYWRATNQGPLSVKIGNGVRYPRAEFEAWLAQQIADTARGEAVSA